MGRVYRVREEYDRALDSSHPSYPMHQRAHPQRLISAANSLHGIGIVYNELQNYDREIEYLTKSLKISEETLSKHHPDIAGTRTNLANVCRDKGEFDRALQHLKRAQNHIDLIRIHDIGLV